jgi:hypothetical protein
MVSRHDDGIFAGAQVARRHVENGAARDKQVNEVREATHDSKVYWKPPRAPVSKAYHVERGTYWSGFKRLADKPSGTDTTKSIMRVDLMVHNSDVLIELAWCEVCCPHRDERHRFVADHTTVQVDTSVDQALCSMEPAKLGCPEY